MDKISLLYTQISYICENSTDMKKTSIILALILMAGISSAQNPIVTTAYTPDPAPFVYGDKLYLFTGHDEDDATYFKMKDWMLYSTEDMVNWTYLGTPVSTATFDWAYQGDRAWASQAVERDGKCYQRFTFIGEK